MLSLLPLPLPLPHPPGLSRCHVRLAGWAPRGSGIAPDLARNSPSRSLSGAPLGRFQRIYPLPLDGTELAPPLKAESAEKLQKYADKK